MQRAFAVVPTVNGNNAILTFLQRSPNMTPLMSRRYTGSILSGFTAPQKVAEAPEIDATVPPSVTLDDDQTATAAWYYDIASPDIYANVSR